MISPRSVLSGAVLLGVAAAGLTTLPATAAPPRVHWADCQPEGEDDPATVRGSQCATLRLPVDWRNPGGPTFDLAIARRTAKVPGERVGTLVFGPGGPGDSGVDRIKTGMERFSADVQDRFDVVSFDPRGIARSNPVLCSAALLARQPSPLMKSQADFDATKRYNEQLAADCRAHTGPLYDHVDTWQTVRDVDAIRRALGEDQITFHGTSYGTMLGAEYAEAYPTHVRAMVLESVLDHSSPTARSFLDAQAATVQDSFDEFVKWCDRDPACVLHGRDIHALWADLLKRSAQGEIPDPREPDVAITPFYLSFAVFRTFYDPQWAGLATMLKTLDESAPPTKQAPIPTGLENNTLTPFCQDWNLSVLDYREFSRLVDRIGRANPDMRYPGQLIAVSSCAGAPPANNPQHRLKVHDLKTPVLLANAIHDPATGYSWAQSVQRQLGRSGVLLTYEGWGHGSYNKSPCMQSTIDSYLIKKDVPKRGTSCPAVPPAG